MEKMQSILRGIEQALSARYPSHVENGKTIYQGADVEFSVVKMGDSDPWNFFVLEYDDGEDGDGFYPDDFDSIDDLITAMIDEIES